MLYQFTGQPGHGKTVLALEFALDMKAKADRLHAEDPATHPYRELYVCNVRDFNHGAAFAVEATPDDIRGWADHPEFLRLVEEFQKSPDYYLLKEKDRDAAMEAFLLRPDVAKLANECINPAFENAIILVDEAYEHRMFPRRPPGRPVPRHVERVAKHRHFGIDFIMVCQSPGKQMDDFLHDLIEEHYHVRRRFGLPLVNLKRWDRFEPRPDKAEPLTTTRRKYPKHIFRLYTSTKYDTSEKRVPWFYWAAAAVLIVTLAIGAYSANRVKERLDSAAQMPAADPVASRDDGARATAAMGGGRGGVAAGRGTPEDYVATFTPRIPAQPWTAPAYDGVLSLPGEPPRLFCMVAGPGVDSRGDSRALSCGCITEQGTRYQLDFDTCATIARHGQYEPYLRPVSAPSSGSSSAPAQPTVTMPPAVTAGPDAASRGGSVIQGTPAEVHGSGIRTQVGVIREAGL